MTTNQKQTSTVGQPAQNCVSVQNQSVKVLTLNGENSLKARYNKGSILNIPSAPVKEKERFSFKDCKAWNTYCAECIDVYVMGNIEPDYTGCEVLSIPDDPHPWNVLRSVIDQFYQRERVIAWERYNARKAIEKAQKLEECNKELDNIRWTQDTRIGELKRELEEQNNYLDTANQRKTPLVEAPARLTMLDELLDISDAGEWVDIMGSILDCVIGLSCYDGNTVSGSDLYFTRRLQEFFMKLDKATEAEVNNNPNQTVPIDPASKYI